MQLYDRKKCFLIIDAYLFPSYSYVLLSMYSGY